MASAKFATARSPAEQARTRSPDAPVALPYSAHWASTTIFASLMSRP